MHVLTRTVNESVAIGDDVEVTVLEIASHFVRVGISSPQSDPPYREQVIHVEPRKPEMPESIRRRFSSPEMK